MDTISQVNSFVFACTNSSQSECFDRMLFGTSKPYGALAMRVKKGDFLFLLNLDTDLLYGVFRATTEGKVNIVPEAWKSEIVGIISCKTSLRERIAQACYWKLELLSSDTTKNVRVFLATTDNDEDFVLKQNRQYGGKSRNRIIAEYELDGIYILRGDFRHEWESNKVKQYEQIFDDLVKIFKRINVRK